MSSCSKAKKWKRRYKRAVSARATDQAKAFETRSKLEGQLRAVDHLLARARFGSEDPTISGEESRLIWLRQTQDFLQELAAMRRDKVEEGYNATDLERMRYSYQEHFVNPFRETMARAFDTAVLYPTTPLNPEGRSVAPIAPIIPVTPEMLADVYDGYLEDTTFSVLQIFVRGLDDSAT